MSDIDPDYDSTTPLIIDGDVMDTSSRKPELISVISYSEELIESGCKIIVLFSIVFCLLFFISVNASALNLADNRNSILDISVANVNIFNLFTAFVSVVSLYVTKPHRHQHIKRHRNMSIMFYSINFLMLVWAIVYVIVYVAKVNEGRMCFYSNLTKYLYVTVLSVIVTGALVVDNNMRLCQPQLPWFPRSLNYFAKSLLCVTFIRLFVWDIFYKIDFDFRKNAKIFFGIHFNTSSFCDLAFNDHEWLSAIFQQYLLSLGLPLYAGIMIVMLITVGNDTRRTLMTKKYVCKSVTSIIICVLVVSAVIGHLVVYLVKVVQYAERKLPQTTRVNFSIGFLCIKCIICLIGIFLVKFKFKNVTKWRCFGTFQSSVKLFDRCFIWFGCYGQLVVATRGVVFATYQLYDYIKQDHYIAQSNWQHLLLLCLILVGSLLMMIETIYQSCLIEVCLDRQWQESSTTGTRKIYPSLVLMSVNVASFILFCYEDLIGAKSLMPENMVMKMFSFIARFVAQIACLLQYLHGIVYFYILAKVTEFRVADPDQTDNQVTC